MLLVIDKPGFQRALSIVRDDRTKENQGLRGPFLRLEAKDDYVKLDGLTVSGKIPATVYEPGVLFLKVTLFRKLLQTIKGEKFLTIQVTADELVMDRIRLPLESNEMLLYANPDQAPQVHPSVTLPSPDSVSKPQPTPQYCPSWLIWNKPDVASVESARAPQSAGGAEPRFPQEDGDTADNSQGVQPTQATPEAASQEEVEGPFKRIQTLADETPPRPVAPWLAHYCDDLDFLGDAIPPQPVAPPPRPAPVSAIPPRDGGGGTQPELRQEGEGAAERGQGGQAVEPSGPAETAAPQTEAPGEPADRPPPVEWNPPPPPEEDEEALWKILETPLPPLPEEEEFDRAMGLGPEPEAHVRKPLIRRFVVAHRFVAFLAVSLGAIALHLWTAYLFLEHWGRPWAIASLFLPPLSEIVAIGACPWWGAWYYALAIVALFVGYGVYDQGEAEPTNPTRLSFAGRWLAGLAFLVFSGGLYSFFSASEERADKAREQQEVEDVAYDICSVLRGEEDPADITKVVAEKDRLRRWIEDHDEREVKRRVDAFLRALALGQTDLRRFLANAEVWDSRFIVSAETREAFSSLPEDLQELFAGPPDDAVRNLRRDAGGRSLGDMAASYKLKCEIRWAVMQERYEDIMKSPMPSREELMRRPESFGKSGGAR